MLTRTELRSRKAAGCQYPLPLQSRRPHGNVLASTISGANVVRLVAKIACTLSQTLRSMIGKCSACPREPCHPGLSMPLMSRHRADHAIAHQWLRAYRFGMREKSADGEDEEQLNVQCFRIHQSSREAMKKLCTASIALCARCTRPKRGVSLKSGDD